MGKGLEEEETWQWYPFQNIVNLKLVFIKRSNKKNLIWKLSDVLINWQITYYLYLNYPYTLLDVNPVKLHESDRWKNLGVSLAFINRQIRI